MNSFTLEIHIRPGTKVAEACNDVKLLSEFMKEELCFYFNGVLISTEDSSIDDMVDNYVTQQR